MSALAQLEVLDDDQHRVLLGLGGEQALERHEQPRLEALRRIEQRRDDRAVVERHAQQVRDQVRDLGDARRRRRPRRRRPGSCRGSRRDPRRRRRRTARSARARSDRRRARSRPRCPTARSRRGCCAADARDQLADDAALAHAGLADDDRERRACRSSNALPTSSWSCAIAAARPVNFGSQVVRRRRDDRALALTLAEVAGRARTSASARCRPRIAIRGRVGRSAAAACDGPRSAAP